MRRIKKHLDTTVRFPWGPTLFLVTPRGSVRSRPRAAMGARCSRGDAMETRWRGLARRR